MLVAAIVCILTLSVQAAVTVAYRVAQELGSSIGHEVGYAIRFEEQTSSSTRIVYLTGLLPGI